MGEDALEVAHEAKNLALRAMTQVEMLQPQLTSISVGISDMRRENVEQHRDNARAMGEGLKEVHARISTVKSSIDINRTTAAKEISELETKLTTKTNTVTSIWDKYRDKAFWLMALLAIALLADKLGVRLPGS